MRLLLPALLLSAVVLAPAVARADGKVELAAVPARAELAVGEDIEVKVTLTAGDDTEVTDLAEDARSVSFELAVDGGKTSWLAQFHTKPQTSFEVPLEALPRKKLKKGEKLERTFSFPAIASGSWSVTTIYAGATPPLETLGGIEGKLQKQRSAAATVKVNPGPRGETQVLARVNTNVGTMVFKFFPKDALASGINFVRIAQSGFYDGKNFHRVDKSLGVVQGGATNPDGSGEFPYSVPRELGLKHEPMRVGMARGQDPNSGSSQFYICANSSPAVLDRPDGYAVFAEVVKGKDVVETLFAVDTKGGQGMEGQQPKTPLKIESVKLQLGS